LTASRAIAPAIGIVRIGNGDEDNSTDNKVVASLEPNCARSLSDAAAKLNTYDVVIIQHEFGIFGRDDGAAVITLLKQLTGHVIVTLHTVPTSPTMQQENILNRIGELADAVIVMSNAARRLLDRSYAITPDKLTVVPHGAHCYASDDVGRSDGRPVILTWGLVGPGKGIEWGIEALAQLRDLDPQPVYQVVGQTHPNVLRNEGERYREHLVALAERHNVTGMLEMRSEYLDHERLERVVGSADIVLLPYDSRDQATSGVLIDAVAAGKPVVATRFPHASDLLSGGAGRLVPHQDATAIADALRMLLCEPDFYDAAAAQASSLAKTLSWTSVAEKYEGLAASLYAERTPWVA
jgi:glycosyltransferase involved in cell wall biosynthesis